MNAQMRIKLVLEKLQTLYPDAHCELKHHNDYEMAVAVILSAQTTDASVNKVTSSLFQKYPTLHSLADADISDIETCISSLGLYRNKARSIQGFAKKVVQDFDGTIPGTMEELVTLPGVGRKCANVILAECFQIPSLAVDTHVNRVSKRLGLSKKTDDVETVEKKLKRLIPREKWILSHHQFIFFGRYLCHARNPECCRCPLKEICREKNLHQKQ